MSQFRPLKAPNDTPESPEDIAKLRWPMYMSPKVDGIRMTNYSTPVSAQNKRFPSKYVYSTYAKKYLSWVDGESGKGEPNSPTLFSDTYSAMMTHGCMDPVSWYVFDFCDPASFHRPYKERLLMLQLIVDHHNEMEQAGRIVVLEQKLVGSWAEALEQEQVYLALGYEGGMLRDPEAPYKFGRSTLLQNILIKLKRFETREAEIIGFYELEHNDNEPTLDERGFTKRSSHKANKRGGNTLGGFVVRDLETGVVFNLGSGIGLDANLRQHIWNNRPAYLGKIVSYKKLKLGEKDKPRNCTFRGFRSPIDL